MKYFQAQLQNVYRHLPRRKTVLVICVVSSSLLVAAYTVNFFRPQTIQLSYSSENCLTLPILFPSGTNPAQSPGYRLVTKPTISFGKTVVFSASSCLTPTKAPLPRSTETLTLSITGLPWPAKHITIVNGAHPRVIPLAANQERITTKDKLPFRLSEADRMFTYQVTAASKTADCGRQGAQLNCDIPSLELAQGADYTLTVHRRYEGKPAGTAFERQVRTVDPIQIVHATIANGQTVYDSPAELVVTLSKPVLSTTGVVLKTIAPDSSRDIPISVLTEGTQVTIRLTQPLPRSTPMRLSIGAASSADGAQLAEPYSLAFSTSGGPKVSRINIGGYKVTAGQSIVLSFDSNLAGGQDLAGFIRLESGGTPVAASLTAAGNQVTIRPAALGACTGFSVRVLDGLKNEFGISGGSAWQHNSRITCQQLFSIGTSAQGRSITAYRYGNGSNKIVYVGGTHGNERSSVTILNRWVEQLEAQAHRIPARSSIVVIPVLNPDGYAANNRLNANNVDLNRNFGAKNWKPGVTMPNKSYLPNGGGTAALSEPESSAIASYLTATRPRLVLSYHAKGSVVLPNDAGDSASIALQYAAKSSVYYASNSQTGALFEYDTTGSMEDWLYEMLGIPTLVIELDSLTSNDYADHQSAMWWTTGL